MASTDEYLVTQGVKAIIAFGPEEWPTEHDRLHLANTIELGISMPEGTNHQEPTSCYKIRRAAVDFGVALMNNIKC
ncbi:putative protein ura1 [Phytophthora infestans]|uniref:Uncharacterized protein n=1 Tax=Phytophthora infestans TaxID=4787 RepID=A0A8S9TQ54_PHYIN|nr:putative protein ura1 [Phytophthora infestans]